MARYTHILIKLMLTVPLLAVTSSAIASNASRVSESIGNESYATGYRHNNFHPVLQPTYGLRNRAKLSQKSADYRSKTEVVAWVKRKYDADVLKIIFNPRTESYRLKILTASGKVRLLTINAKR